MLLGPVNTGIIVQGMHNNQKKSEQLSIQGVLSK